MKMLPVTSFRDLRCVDQSPCVTERLIGNQSRICDSDSVYLLIQLSGKKRLFFLLPAVRPSIAIGNRRCQTLARGPNLDRTEFIFGPRDQDEIHLRTA